MHRVFADTFLPGGACPRTGERISPRGLGRYYRLEHLAHNGID